MTRWISSSKASHAARHKTTIVGADIDRCSPLLFLLLLSDKVFQRKKSRLFHRTADLLIEGHLFENSTLEKPVIFGVQEAVLLKGGLESKNRKSNRFNSMVEPLGMPFSDFYRTAIFENELNCRMPNGTYGGVRGKGTKVGQKNFRFPTYSIHFPRVRFLTST